MAEIYVSTDVETDGPIPGVNSMLSFASAAYLARPAEPSWLGIPLRFARGQAGVRGLRRPRRPVKTLVGTFEANLETLPGAVADPKTMAWWQNEPEAWAACRADSQPPEAAMRHYLAWLKSLPGKPVFVAYPAAFDFMFVCWYLHRFTGENPFSHSALDIKTYAMAMLKKEYRESVKRNMPRRWFDPLPHTHRALDDAIEQGALFCNMLAEHVGRQTDQ